MSDIVFTVTSASGSWVVSDDALPPELQVFFPDGFECKQLNYGQGEGQVLIDGAEWGFYLSAAGEVNVILHGGSLSSEEAERVVTAICDHLERMRGEPFSYRVGR